MSDLCGEHKLSNRHGTLDVRVELLDFGGQLGIAFIDPLTGERDAVRVKVPKFASERLANPKFQDSA